MAKSDKAMVIEIHGPDDIRTHNALRHECAGWTWRSGILYQPEGNQLPTHVTPRLAERIDAVLEAGVFPVDVPYCLDKSTNWLDIRSDDA